MAANATKSRFFAQALNAGRESPFAAIPQSWKRNIAGDLSGGLLAALVSIPMSIGFGMLAFAPLGPEYVPIGIVAGLFGAAFMNLVALVAGANGSAMYAPRSLIAFMISSVALHAFAGQVSVFPEGKPLFVAAALFATLSLGGLLQLVFGIARLGGLVRFIPTPVMAGFQNAAAILILYSQLHVALGLPAKLPLSRLLEALAAAKPLNVAVFATSLAIIWQGERITRRIPAALTGLLLGTLLYYVLVLAGFGAALGPTVGAIPMGLPDGSYLAAMMMLTTAPAVYELVPSMLAAAVSLAIVASLDVLICSKIVEGVSGQRVSGDAQLVRTGTANIVVPLLGGLSGAISIAASTANARAGGRTSLSMVVQATVVLAVLVLLAPLIARLPLAVIAAVLTVTAIQLMDRWTLELGRKVLTREAVDWPIIALDLSIIGIVAGIAMSGNIVLAVVVGMAIAIVLFVLRMSRSVIRFEEHGDVLHSRRTREALECEILAREGRKILVLHLEGPVFFGSAESLALRIDAAARDGVRYVILDLRRVNDMDSTGARIIVQAHKRLKETGGTLLLSAPHSTRVATVLRDIGVRAALTEERVFPDTDRALEWAEERVVAQAKAPIERAGDYPFAQLDIVAGMPDAERERFRAMLQRREYRRGERIVRENASGDELYIVVRGSASVMLELPAEGRVQRLMSFSAGTLFGEVALLDRLKRSATVVADEDLACYVLTRAAYDELVREEPATTIVLLTNVARAMGARLRRANRALYQLEF